MMFYVKHFFLALTIIGATFWGLAFRVREGAELSGYISQIEREQPEVLVLGNSVTRAGIDDKQLSQLTGKRSLKVTSNGAATRWWYLYIKNVLLESQYKPKLVVIGFRDHFLTEPLFRTEGRYQRALRMISRGEAPMSLSWVAEESQRLFERYIMKVGGLSVGVNRHRAKDAFNATFADENMSTVDLTKKQLASEQAGDQSCYDFRNNVDRSLLPDIVDMCREAGIDLMFVRAKRRRDINPDEQPEALQTYVKELSGYLEENNVALLDSTSLPINETYYGPGDHLNDTGMAIWTEFLAEKIR